MGFIDVEKDAHPIVQVYILPLTDVIAREIEVDEILSILVVSAVEIVPIGRDDGSPDSLANLLSGLAVDSSLRHVLQVRPGAHQSPARSVEAKMRMDESILHELRPEPPVRPVAKLFVFKDLPEFCTRWTLFNSVSNGLLSRIIKVNLASTKVYLHLLG